MRLTDYSSVLYVRPHRAYVDWYGWCQKGGWKEMKNEIKIKIGKVGQKALIGQFLINGTWPWHWMIPPLGIQCYSNVPYKRLNRHLVKNRMIFSHRWISNVDYLMKRSFH